MEAAALLPHENIIMGDVNIDNHYVKGGILDHLSVFFTTAFPVRNSCSAK